MPTVAVIGSGFTGTMVACHLLRDPNGPQVLLFERSGRWGPGVAYGTRCAAHALNVPAGRMSAYPTDPDHFLAWLKSTGRAGAEVSGGSFVPRMVYGEYLSAQLDHAEAAARPGRLRRLPSPVLSVRPEAGGVVIHVAGSSITVDRAVLALGNYAPANPPLTDPAIYASARYTRDPWSGSGIPELAPDAPVLLIGTSLTMMDIALELAARGHRGQMHAVSRRGLLSQPHRAHAKPYHRDRPGDLDLWPSTARGMLRKLRQAVREAAGKGVDWREVVTSLRADTPRLWQRLGPVEQARFLRHARAYWDTHRHRAAPETWAGVEALMHAGRLVIHPARLLSMSDVGAGVDVRVKPRREDRELTLRVAHVVNCTGPETDPRRVDDPLLKDLLQRGIAVADTLGLGLLTSADYGLISAEGRVWDRLRVVGPMQRPLLWETTAVPELRVHAAAVATQLLKG